MQTRPFSISFGGHYTFYSKKRGVKQVKRYKEIIKKLGAVTLALAMTATMVPGQALAEESVPDGQQVQQDTQQETEQDAQQSGEEAVQPGDEQKSENDGEKAAQQDGVQENGTESAEAVKETEGQKEEGEAAAGEAGADATVGEAAGTDAENVSGDAELSSEGESERKAQNEDINKPVIESVKVVQQDETLHEGDTVQVRVDAYDADSGISYVEIYMRESYETGSDGRWLDVAYDETEGCYIGTLLLDNVGTGRLNITELRVVDNNNNYEEAVLSDENGYLYGVNLENDVNTVTPVNVDFPENEEVLTERGYEEFQIAFPEEVPEYSSVSAVFGNESGTTGSVSFWMDWETGLYKSSSISGYQPAGVYTVTSVTINRLGEDIEVLLDGEYSFTLEEAEEIPGTEDDTEMPVITSVSLDKNAEVVRAGDVVTVTVKAEDNLALDKEYAYAYFNAVSDIVDSKEYVALAYSEEQQAYVGKFVIEDGTYPCEWYLDQIHISDMAGNTASYWELLNKAPYYVQVYQGNTFVNPVYDVTYSFNTLTADGWYESADTVEAKVERRQTLAEAGVQLPVVESEYEGLAITGWCQYDGTPFTLENTQIVNSSYESVYATYDQIPVHVSFGYIGEGGEYAYISEMINMPLGSTYGDVAEKVSDREYPGGYDELEFTGWELSNWDLSEADEEIQFATANVDMSAVYTTIPVNVVYEYADADGNWKESSQLYSVAKDTTYGELRQLVESYEPEDMTAEYPFEFWETYDYEFPEDDETIRGDISWVYDATAKYEGKNVILLDLRYFNPEGRGANFLKYIPVFFDEDVVLQDVMDYVNAQELPEMFEGLRFSEWEPLTQTQDVLENARAITIEARYENCMVRFLLDPMMADLEHQQEPINDNKLEAVFGQVAEVGDTITLPGSFEGYDNVLYFGESKAGDTYTVDGNKNFYGYTEEMLNPEEPGTEPEEPGTTPEEPGTEPEEPGTTPEEPGTEPEEPGTTPEKPPVEVPDDSVSTIAEMVQNTSEGQKVDVDMGAATVVPKEVLEAAQGRDVTVELKMDGYTWTINGKDIAASNLQDINLEVTLNSNAIPSNTVKKLAGNNPVEQLSLTHNGDFGFRADLTINVGSDNAGKFGNLYYYDSDGRMVFMNAGTIREDGTVSLSFSHASDYVVVISDKQMSQANVPDDLQPVKDSGKDQTTDGNKTSGQGQNTGKGSVKTGDMSPVIPTVIVLILAAAVIAGVVVVKKRQK